MPSGIYQHKKGYKIQDTSGMNKDKIGKKRPPRSERWKKKLSESWENVPRMLGKHHSGKTKEKISDNKKGKHTSPNTEFKKGQMPWNNGKKRPEMTGEKHFNWQGGKSFEPYSVDWTDDLKDSIRKRDDYICCLCGIHQDELNEKLHCHHIDYDKKNLNPENLISLCRKCHIKTNFNRNYWINYFSIKQNK